MPDTEQGPIEVVVESYLEDLIPGYLDNRRADAVTIESALGEGDLETARSLGHQMKGSGGGYGFDRLTEIGAQIEQAAREGDCARVRQAVAAMRDYLDRVVVRYG